MVRYLRLQDSKDLPNLGELKPYKAVVVIEETVSRASQEAISKWLVDTGCLYMMAWGPDCGSWDTSVDEANIEKFGYGEIPEDAFVMTTWHEKEPLEEVFWFAKNSASHPTKELENTLLLHLAQADNAVELEQRFSNA